MTKDNLFISQFPGYVGLKNPQSEYIAVGESFAKLAGFSSPTEMIGIRDHKIKCDAAMLAASFEQEDRLTLERDQETHWLYLAKYADSQPMILHGTKKPFYRGNGGKRSVLCTMVSIDKCFDVAYSITHDIVQSDEKRFGCWGQKYQIDDNYPQIHLTTRQAECLFYLIRGKSIKEIAAILTLSARTVESYFGHIRNKLGCMNKSELIDYAISHGFVNVIIKTVLSKKNISLSLD